MASFKIPGDCEDDEFKGEKYNNINNITKKTLLLIYRVLKGCFYCVFL